jgi:N utilization substance protein A
MTTGRTPALVEAPEGMKSEFLMAITQLSAEKNLPKDVVFEAVEAALASAYKKDMNSVAAVSVKIDQATGNLRAFTHKLIVEEIENPRDETTLEEARAIRPDAQLGETVPVETPAYSAGRIAAQTAKQVVLQRLREAEREVVYDEYVSKENDILSGVVQRIEPRQVIIDLGKTEAVLPGPEQARGEHFRPGQRVKIYVLEVQKATKGPQVYVSRTHKNLIRRLFELEVPEIHRGLVEIKSIAREPGSRSKVAVGSRQEGIDPVGACVGLRGIRIQNVVNELNGERIDVVQWDPDPARFVAHALSPARVVSVRVDDDSNTATVVVPDQQLSLAIGKEGQNARLAAKLTGWRIDIKAESVALLEPEAAPEAVESVFTAPAPAREEIEDGLRVAAEPVPVPAAAIEAEEVAEFPEAIPAEVTPVPEPEAEPVPVAAVATPAARTPGGIRFAEELLGAPARALPATDSRARGRGRGERTGREEEEEAAARARRAGGRRRRDQGEEEDEDDPYAEYASKFR